MKDTRSFFDDSRYDDSQLTPSMCLAVAIVVIIFAPLIYLAGQAEHKARANHDVPYNIEPQGVDRGWMGNTHPTRRGGGYGE